MIKVIGIDPGFAKIGISIIEVKVSKKKFHIKKLNTVFIFTNNIFSDHNRLKILWFRLYFIFLLHCKNTDYIFVEKVFFNKNITSSHKVSQVIGYIEWMSWYFNIFMYKLTPSLIKKNITQKGNSKKKIIKEKLNKLIYKTHKKDEIDAIACAITGIQVITNTVISL